MSGWPSAFVRRPDGSRIHHQDAVGSEEHHDSTARRVGMRRIEALRPMQDEDQDDPVRFGVHFAHVTQCEAYLVARQYVGAANRGFSRTVLMSRVFAKGNYV